jgi:triacylglycerol lipase
MLRLARLLICLGLSWVATLAHAGTSAQPRYPIVLVHGFMGFNKVLGLEYFYRIPEALRQEGATVYIASVNPAQSTAFRGEQLVQQLKAWAARDGIRKFNLLGHSHGGPTVRYAAAAVPEMVASVTTYAGSNFGSKVADGLLPQVSAGSLTDQAATGALQLLGWLNGTDQYQLADFQAAMRATGTAESLRFNERFPTAAPTSACGQGPEKADIRGQTIHWYSATGSAVMTNPLDFTDWILAAVSKAYMGGEDNDGLVTRCATHWGKVIKDNYAWNHLDEINQALGVIGPFAPSPEAFFIQHANRLKQRGL